MEDHHLALTFPFSLIHVGTSSVRLVHSVQELIDALLTTSFTTNNPSQRDAVLTEACLLAHAAHLQELRSRGETVCEECNTHVMEQFMECSCACLAIPKDPIWIHDGAFKIRRTPDTMPIV